MSLILRKKRNIILGCALGLFLIVSVNIYSNFLSINNPLYNEYESTYGKSAHHNDIISHYKIYGQSVYYYENCANGIKVWCKNLIQGVDPQDFIPLGKDYAKVASQKGTNIYYKNINITTHIASPDKFQALLGVTTNPKYFTDEEYLYFDPKDFTPKEKNYVDGKEIKNLAFPIKLNPGDIYRVPEELSTTYRANKCFNQNEDKKVLFLNKKVYIDGELFNDTNADSFRQIKFANDSVVGPWFADINHVYHNDQIVYKADPSSFILLQSSTASNSTGCPAAGSIVAKDENYFYFASQEHPICLNETDLCTVDLRVPNISTQNIKILDVIDIYALQKRQTLQVAEDEYYLDGLKKNRDSEVEVLVAIPPGYIRYGAKNKFILWTFVNSDTCGYTGKNFEDRPVQDYSLFINNNEIQNLTMCSSRIESILLEGDNQIRVENAKGETVFTRSYLN